MKNKSILEDILEIAFKSPIAGVILSVFFGGLGLYLTNVTAPVGAKPTGAMFLPMYHMFGNVSYFLSVLALLVAGIGYVVTSIKKKKQTSYFGTRRTLDDIKNLSWKEFEEFVGSLFTKLGYSVEVTGGLNDGGVDLIVKKDDRISLVQCKNYRVNKVNLSKVRDFYGAMNANLNFDVGYLITTGIFTLDAMHFAEDKPIELIDGAKLMDYVEMTETKKVPQRKPENKIDTPQKIPTCPKCGADMVLRTANKGDRAGSKFWGCSNFPKCYATKLVGTE